MKEFEKHNAKSIEQLEGDYWPEVGTEVSGLIRRCHAYRKVPITALSNEQLRTLISQNIGTEFIISIILERLEENPLAEGDLYEGDLLVATARIAKETWAINPLLLNRFLNVFSMNRTVIAKGLGDSSAKRLEEGINEIETHFDQTSEL